MEITIVHGQAHKGSTYRITTMIKENLADSDVIVNEYFMPKDTPGYCAGCYQCIQKGEEYCPEAEKVQKIVASMLRSDIILFDSPNYCYEMTGQLKTLMDHLAFMWMPHRPQKEMFSKTGIVISTAAGGGAGKVTKSMARQLFWWGVPKIYRMKYSVNAAQWDEVPEKIKQKIIRETGIVSQKIRNRINRTRPGIRRRPGIRTILIFNIMRKMQGSNTWNVTDKDYWQKNGWLAKARPWR